MELRHLCVNDQWEYLGLDDFSPVFSWQLTAAEKNTLQTAWQIVVAQEGRVVWDSGVVEGDTCSGIPYGGQTLESRKRYTVTIRVRDNHGNEAAADTWFEMGLTAADWSAQWIEPELPACRHEEKINISQATLGRYQKTPPESRLQPCTYLRRNFRLDGTVRRARLYAAVHGIYTCQLNGEAVNDTVWAQEFTPYHKEIRYQVYDVTEQLHTGENAIGFTIADGWWCGRYGMNGGSCEYGDRHALLMQLEIQFADGSVHMITSDEAFKAGYGPERYADLFIGEKYDATAALCGWAAPDFDDAGWSGVQYAAYDNRLLRAQQGQGVRVSRRFPAKEILTTPAGETVVDLGENIAGFVRMCVQAPRGTCITLEHSEVLSKKGNFLKNIMGRNKDQVDVYICRGHDDVFEPRFTFHGFRYVRVTGIPAGAAASFEGVEITSVPEPTGSFETSDSRLNLLQQNIVRSQIANMISIPTDCPQRERAGWTGDLQVFFNTAVFNRDVNVFLTRWLQDLALEQLPNGEIPHVVPYTSDYRELMNMQFQSDSSSGWSDVGVIVPMGLYRHYGNRRVLQAQYGSMKKWCDYAIARAHAGRPKKYKPSAEAERYEPYLWDSDFHWGDHLIPSITKKMGVMAIFGVWPTRPVAATAYLYHSTSLLAEAAEILGNAADAAYYREIAEKVAEAFQYRFFTPEGRMKPDWQSSYVLALGMGLVPERWKAVCLSRLQALIRKNGGCMDCGFLSIQYLLDVLSQNGCARAAYDLLFQEKCPSWLFEVKMGGTSIWEAWNATAPNGKTGTFSYNHYAFGCVGDWMYRNILGIQNSGVGYKHITIAPLMDDRLRHAKGSYQSAYGPIHVAWERDRKRFVLDVEIPANTTAEIILPDQTRHSVGSGSWTFACDVDEWS